MHILETMPSEFPEVNPAWEQSGFKNPLRLSSHCTAPADLPRKEAGWAPVEWERGPPLGRQRLLHVQRQRQACLLRVLCLWYHTAGPSVVSITRDPNRGPETLGLFDGWTDGENCEKFFLTLP